MSKANDGQRKQDLIKNYKKHDNDTGSSRVQIAIITDRINYLVDHLKQHKKDNHSRRGLVMLVGQRKRLMKYLRRKDLEKYEKVVNELKIRG